MSFCNSPALMKKWC